MAQATEVLRLIIDADGKGAVRGVESVGDAADKNLGRVDGRLDRVGAAMTSFGATTVAAAAVAGAGLYKFAQSASDYGEAASAAGVIFDDASDIIEDFGEQASKTAGISKTAAVDAANQFGTFGKAAGLAGDDLALFSTDLVQLAGDLASFKNTTPQEAVEALGAALRGESEPLRRYGVLLDDATLKTEAMELGIYDGNGALTTQQKILAANEAIFKQTSDAQGDFERTSGSLANQQRILAAEFENTKVAIGEGLLPFAETALDVVGGLAEGFNNLDDNQKDAIGTMAGWATVGAGVVGALSLVAGQVIKMREAFTTVDATGTRSLTNLGRVARGVSIGAGIIGGLAALNAGLDAATAKTTEFQTALDNLTAAKSGEEALADLLEAAESSESGWKNLVEAMNPVPEVLTTVGEGSSAVTFELDELENAMKAAADAGKFDQLSAGISELERLAEASGKAMPPEVAELIERYRDRIDAAGDAAAATSPDVENLGDVIGAQAGSTEQATNALRDWSDALKATTDPFFAVIDAVSKMDEAERKRADAVQRINDLQAFGAEGTDDYAQALRDLDAANVDVVKSAGDQFSALADLEAKVRDGEVSVTDAQIALMQYAQSTSPEVQEAARLMGEKFVYAADKADELGQRKPRPTAELEDRPFWLSARGVEGWYPDTKTGYIVGNSTDFWHRINDINRYQIPPKYVPIYEATSFLTLGGAVGRMLGNPRMRAKGGPIDPNKAYVVGEEGPELFVSDTAGTIIPNSATPSHVGGSLNTNGNGGTIVVNVNGPVMSAADAQRWMLEGLREARRQGKTTVAV